MRRHDREITEQEKIDAFIESCDCLRLGLSTQEGPYIVPLNFAYEAGTVPKFYFHSAKEGQKVTLIGSGVQAGFELDGAHRLGTAEIGCRHTFFYQSVIGTGLIRPVEKPEEKKRALAQIMAHYRKDQAFSFTDEQAHSVAVFCLEVRTLSCKAHL